MKQSRRSGSVFRDRRVRRPLLLLLLLPALALLVQTPTAVWAQATDATLSALTVNDGTVDADLRPTFSSSVMSYRVAVKYRGDSITVAATPTDGNATVAFLDAADSPLGDADSGTTGYQVDVPVGESTFKVEVTAEDSNTTLVYEVVVERDSPRLYEWTPSRDLNGLADAGNDDPQDLWSDGTTIWVADDADDKLYAYTLATGAYDSSKDISLHSDNADPTGVWSDGTTIWVADSSDGKLYAYTLSSGARASGSDMDLHSRNTDPAGMWSDGTDIWVADGSFTTSAGTYKVFKYRNGSRTARLELQLDEPASGIWSDGTTMWAITSIEVEAYRIDLNADGTAGPKHRTADADKAFPTRRDGGTASPGMWSDGKGAVWIVDPDGPSVESYHMLPSSAGDTTLSALSINDGTNDVSLRPAFRLSETNYRAAVSFDVGTVTVAATASEASSTVQYVDTALEKLDDESGVDGHQVSVAAGGTEVGILVTSTGGVAFLHTVAVERDSPLVGGRTPTEDLYLDPVENIQADGMWSDGTTMWVVDSLGALYAYNLSTGERDTTKEFELDASNSLPDEIWSDGTTMWLWDWGTNKFFAYTLASGARDAAKDVVPSGGASYVRGIWSDGTTMYVAYDEDGPTIRAYSMADGTRLDGTNGADDKELELRGTPSMEGGIWSDGTTLWVAYEDKIDAFTLADGTRDERKDFVLSLDQPRGIWSDGTTMWVADWTFFQRDDPPTHANRAFAYRMPFSAAGDTTLSSLTVSPEPAVASFTPTLRPGFTVAFNHYRVAVPHEAEVVTVDAVPSHSSASVSYRDGNGATLPDADGGVIGHQVAVGVGTTVIEVFVTRSGADPTSYMVTVERDSAELWGWTSTRDFNALLEDNPDLASDRIFGSILGIWANSNTLYVTPYSFPKVFAYSLADGSRDAAKDIATNQGSLATTLGFKTGIWSDGTTLWVLDHRFGHDSEGNEVLNDTGKLFAYDLATGARDTTKEFGLFLDATGFGSALWSDGITVWVSHWGDSKLFAYTLDTGARDAAKDITLHSENAFPQGIWSDGDTIWVADWEDDKFYAYTLTPGSTFGERDRDKEFDLAPDNGAPRDAWSDGTTLWIPDALGQKLYSYNMAPQVTILDTTAPTVSAATVTGYLLEVRFDEDLAAAPNLSNAAFTVKRTPEAGNEQTVRLDSSPSISGATVTLRLKDPVVHTDTDVKVSYSKPSTDDQNRLGDAAGNDVESFTDWPVTNNAEVGGQCVESYYSWLSSLTVNGIGGSLVSMERFRPGVRSYTVWMSPGTSAVTLSTTVQNPNYTQTTERSQRKERKVITGPRAGEHVYVDRVKVTTVHDFGSYCHRSRYYVTAYTPRTQEPDGLFVDGGNGGRNVYERPGAEVRFVVRLKPARSNEVTVDYFTADAIAKAGQDYVATEGRLTFAPGETRKEVTVEVLDDDVNEGLETFYLKLANASNAYVQRAQNFGYISNSELTATFKDLPEKHDGRNPFSFRIAFNQPTTMTAAAMRDHALTVRGGTVTAAARVGDSQRELWKLTVQPSGTEDVSLLLPGSRPCTEAGAVCASDDRPLSASVSGSVTGPVWSSTMTTEEVYQDYGYSGFDGHQRGSLTSDSFEFDGVTYTVKLIESSDWIYIGFDKEVPFRFTLEVDGVELHSDHATSSTYSSAKVLTWSDQDMYWGDGDEVELVMYRSDETATSTGETAASTAAVGGPTITGTAQVGQTLTADTSGISDADGLASVSYTYQWIRNDGTTDTDISGATSSTYTLVDADEGKFIKVKVSFTDDADNDEELTSEATAAVAVRPNRPVTGAVTVTGTAQVGETLTADTSGISDADGLTNVSYEYQWIANDGTTDTDIENATGSTYTLLAADEGDTVKVKVSFTDDAGHSETLTSAATDEVSLSAQPQRSNSAPTGAPTITGTAQVGQTLTADTSGISDADGLTSVSYAYQWIRNDGNDDTDISGATGSTYTLVDADQGKTIKVQVSFTDDAGNDEELTSAATAAVAKPPLTAVVADEPSLHDGQRTFTFELRFSEEVSGLSFRTLRDEAFEVSGGSVTRAKRQTQDSNIGWVITVEPDSDADVTISLPATTDCADDGAICTEDGRKLSKPLNFTVSGPN